MARRAHPQRRRKAAALLSAAAVVGGLLPTTAAGNSLRSVHQHHHRGAPPAAAAPAAATASASSKPAPPTAKEDAVRASEANHGTGESEKVEHLLLDIDESVRKAGSDAEFVYATLYSYDQQLQANLDKEVERVNQELAKLKKMHNTSESVVDDAARALGKIGGGAPAVGNATKGDAAGQQSAKELATKREAVKVLACFVQQGSATGCVAQGAAKAQGQSAAAEAPKKRLAGAVREAQALLRDHPELRAQFPDVFAAFLPSSTPAALLQAKGKAHATKVHLTRKLRARTLQALGAVETSLDKREAELRAQEHVEELRRASAASMAEAHDEATRGVEAEAKQDAEEVQFSITFAEAVLHIDHDFVVKVHENMRKKGELVEAIRASRDSQHQTLHSLVDLLQGKYSINAGAEAQSGPAAAVPVSFLQAAATSGARAKQHAASGRRGLSQAEVSTSIRDEVEHALKHKADTHGILLRVKAMLDRSAPIDSDSVRGVVGGLQGVLRQLESEQTRSEEVKHACEAQSLSSGDQAHSLQASLVLMNAVQNRTQAAIQSAKQNLASIVRKMTALEDSSKDFVAMVGRTTHSLEDQSNDRRTIMAAVRKVRSILSPQQQGAANSGEAADALLLQMLKELERQDGIEASYRAAEVSFRTSFLAYAKSYVQLLGERRGHYSSSLSALDLYETEVESDLAAQAESASTGEELHKESKELCAGLLSYYSKHHERASKLAHTLHEVVPRLPAFFSAPGMDA